MTFIAKALIHRGYAELFPSGGSRKCAIAEFYILLQLRARRGIKRSLKLFIQPITGSCRKAIEMWGRCQVRPHLPCARASLAVTPISLGVLTLLERPINCFNVHLVSSIGLDNLSAPVEADFPLGFQQWRSRRQCKNNATMIQGLLALGRMESLSLEDNHCRKASQS